MALLNQQHSKQLPASVLQPQALPVVQKNHIMHIGIGGFHRAHQAYTWHQLIQSNPEVNAAWRITGVCLLPSDKPFVEAFRKQDQLYCLRSCAADGKAETMLINSLQDLLFGPEDAEAILAKIADPATRIISFTITEGGYNVDFEQKKFLLDTAAIAEDLNDTAAPKTVFGFLAKGLQRRKEAGLNGLTLMSCDNIQENGEVLHFALDAYLDAFDPELKAWVAAHVHFPNSMVDRITPVTKSADMDAFEASYGLRDEALIVCEDYFQWVLEDKGLDHIPYLPPFGVEVVSDVRPYESMKLGILNAGHSLVGLIGNALGIYTIHEAVQDPMIARIFTHYAKQEAIPVLQEIKGVSFTTYFEKVKSRFSNAMINDSTARIISGSSDKIPKFLLPITLKQFKQENPQWKATALVIAFWWFYLHQEYAKNELSDILDNRKTALKGMFQQKTNSIDLFIAMEDIFGELGSQKEYYSCYAQYATQLATGDGRAVLSQFLEEVEHA